MLNIDLYAFSVHFIITFSAPHICLKLINENLLILWHIIAFWLYLLPKLLQTVYKITMTYLELCETGSTTANCLRPLVVGTGDSGLINIADTSAGVAAASYGDFTKVPFGTTYSHYQVTMKRAVKIKGSVSDGSNTCYTVSNNGDISKNVVGSTNSSDEAEITAYMAMTISGLGDEINSISAGDGTGTAQAAGTVDNDAVSYTHLTLPTKA